MNASIRRGEERRGEEKRGERQTEGTERKNAVLLTDRLNQPLCTIVYRFCRLSLTSCRLLLLQLELPQGGQQLLQLELQLQG